MFLKRIPLIKIWGFSFSCKISRFENTKLIFLNGHKCVELHGAAGPDGAVTQYTCRHLRLPTLEVPSVFVK